MVSAESSLLILHTILRRPLQYYLRVLISYIDPENHAAGCWHVEVWLEDTVHVEVVLEEQLSILTTEKDGLPT